MKDLLKELKIMLITFALCAIILIVSGIIFEANMVQFIVGVLLYLVMKREVKDWDDSGRL